jgi:uncharacterized circularly permuted ATP-grasp superfamily protein/uncharacterized alpha-E superfamily protein
MTALSSASAAAEQAMFDEMVTGSGTIRPHWQPIVGALTTLPPLVFAERVERARRQFQENGVTYNVYNDPKGVDRGWSVDLLPLPIPPDEWERIESGLAQRAQLFNAILADIYGPQKLLHDRHYPPSLVFGNARYLRACAGLAGTGRNQLHIYAADLVRAVDGGWWVLSDRLDAPSGAGYALENRNVLARTLQEAFRAAPVRRLQPFFELWQAALQNLSPRGRDNPRMVLLTPGPYNETYFEHVYLARELGLTLVEGADLTVRDSRVYLKTLGGLQQVDVILRRQDSEFCDPLELRADSTLGVVGLVQAVRAGNVVIANPLGAGVIESPALSAFLPVLCRTLLGEELALPSVATWWLGQKRALDEVEAAFERMVIKPSFPARGMEPVFAGTLSAAERTRLMVDIKAQPWRYCAQERVRSSAMPVWTPAGLTPQPMVLRVFVVNDNGRFTAMPGGLTRVSGDVQRPIVSMQRGGVSKDTWVLAREGYDPVVVPSPATSRIPPIRRSGDDLPSRAAEDLFWLGRYIERLDNSARVLRCALSRIGASNIGVREQLEITIANRMAASYGLLDQKLIGIPADSTTVLHALAQACAPGPAMNDIFRAIQRLITSVRQRLSADMWNVGSTLLGEVRGRMKHNPNDIDKLLRGLDLLIETLAALGGMASENMTRHAGWRFLDMGRRLERSLFSVAAARAAIAPPGNAREPGLRVALELCDSTITYRSRYLMQPRLAPVLDLVLTDDTNPRALAFQLVAMTAHIDALPRREERPFSGMEEKLAHGALAALRLFDVEALSDARSVGAALDRLRDLLDDTGRRMQALSDALTRAFFSHVKPAQALGYSPGGN